MGAVFLVARSIVVAKPFKKNIGHAIAALTPMPGPLFQSMARAWILPPSGLWAMGLPPSNALGRAHPRLDEGGRGLCHRQKWSTIRGAERRIVVV